MARTKIPKSFKKTLKKNVKANNASSSNSKQAKSSLKSEARKYKLENNIKKKITWNINQGDLVKFKRQGNERIVYGIVLEKSAKTNWNNTETDEYVIVMSSKNAREWISPKSLQVIQHLQREKII